MDTDDWIVGIGDATSSDVIERIAENEKGDDEIDEDHEDPLLRDLLHRRQVHEDGVIGALLAGA